MDIVRFVSNVQDPVRRAELEAAARQLRGAGPRTVDEVAAWLRRAER